MAEAKRNYLIDNLKVLLIFFVVFGHVIEYYIESNHYLRFIYLFIYFFHMPLFIFISGYLSKNIDKGQKTAIKNLLIPYIIFNIIWYTLAYIVTGEMMWLIIYPGWTLWYLISLFFWRVSLKYLIKIPHIVPISILCGLLIGFLPRGGVVFSASRTITFLPFFLIGYYTNEDYLLRVSRVGKRLSVLGVLTAMIVAFYIGKSNLIDYNFFYNSQSYMESGLSSYEGLLMRGTLYVGSTLLSVCVLNLIPRKKVFFTRIGEQTMNIYVFHPYLTIIVYAIIYGIQRISHNAIISIVLMFISPIAIIYLLSRKPTQKIYSGMFKPIHFVVYSPRMRRAYKKGYRYIKPKMIRITRKKFHV